MFAECSSPALKEIRSSSVFEVRLLGVRKVLAFQYFLAFDSCRKFAICFELPKYIILDLIIVIITTSM